MLKKSYKIFLITGMAAAVVAGIFFICSLQNQLSNSAEAAKARREAEQSGIVYLSPREVPENAFFALETMEPAEYEAAARLIPKDWQYAPIASIPGDLPAVTASGRTSGEASVLYSTPDFFSVQNMRLLEGSFEGDASTCAASGIFMEVYGLKLEDSPAVDVDGQVFRITAVFEASDKAGDPTGHVFIEETTAQLLVLPYEAAKENLRLSRIALKKPEELSLEDFEARLARLEEQLNSKAISSDADFHAQTTAAFSESSSVPSAGATVLLGIFFFAFLGEFLAGANIMSLANAGILESREKIGVKLAVGASHGAVFREFIGELLLVCAKGALLGAAVSAVLVYYANQFMGSFLFLFDGTTLLLIASVIFCVCFTAGYFPFRAILKQQPISLLRKESLSMKVNRIAYLHYFLVALILGLALSLNISLDDQFGVVVLLDLFGIGVVVICAFGLLGTLMTAIQQGRTAVGVQMAVGAETKDILRLVLFDTVLKRAALPVLLGSISAQLLLGSGALRLLDSHFPVEFSGLHAALCMLLSLCFLLFCALYPAVAAARLQPAAILKGD